MCAGGGGASVVSHPVLFLSRFAVSNVYHFMEDVVSVFLALAVLDTVQLRTQGIQVSWY